MARNVDDVLCKALELTEKAAEAYRKAKAACSEALGAEVFGLLLKDKEESARRIADIRRSLGQGKGFADACRLPEEDARDLSGVLAGLAARYAAPKDACLTERESLKLAADLEQAGVSFYEAELPRVQDKVEKEFLRFMLGESRDHYMLVRDMQSYYEDPEGWTRAKGRGGLDGA
ncbi:MAG: hypothetical protein AB1916_00700 [Thermodesulfobacteriota bacterium]